LTNIEEALASSFSAMLTNYPDIEHKLNNMQSLHECKDSRDDHFLERQNERKRASQNQTNNKETIGNSKNDDFFFGDPNDIGDEILEHIESSEASRSETNSRSCQDAEDCVRHADHSGMFDQPIENDAMDTLPDFAQHREISDTDLEQMWTHEYEQGKVTWKEKMKNPPDRNPQLEATPQALETSLQNSATEIDTQSAEGSRIAPAIMPKDTIENNGNENVASVIKQFSFNKKQEWAFSIVAKHSIQDQTEQLRMFLGGPGGTGKSQVINGLRTFFEMNNQDRRFRLASFTGVAAHNIKGMTLHAALGLNQQCKGASTRVTQELIAMWRGVDYLFIDEVSMIGCHLLLKVHKALCVAKECSKPFGGINIIFAGDFAQLPPVGDTRLNSRINTRRASTNRGQDEILGKLLWLSVDTCVLLEQIMRQQGAENQPFVNLLQRLRTGLCTEDDYNLLSSKLVSHARPDWSQTLWNQAPVIVSNNEAKDKINEQCAHAFAARTHRELHYYHASDQQGKIPIEHEELNNKLKTMHTGKTEQRMGLLPLVIGMPVMICANFDVSSGVVNGCIGTLRDVHYTVDEHGNRHARSCVVCLPNKPDVKLTSLAIGEVAVLEDTCSMSFVNPHSGKRCSIKRTQLPIVPAFAITGHKSQGRTLEATITDIQSCRGTESVYVMLSRVTSINNLRILRPFNIKKIQCRPSEDSRQETKRQKILNLRTIFRYGTEAERKQVENSLTNFILVSDPSKEDPQQLENIQKEMESMEAMSSLKRKKPENVLLKDSSRLLKKRHINKQ
jgi:hypothetical protein